MRVRIKYTKQGRMKFIGHLDMMRFFQKACRRADIDVTYTEGMSPHMSMSYALPLGVGMTSDSEYVDVDLNCAPSEEALLEKLNDCAPEGVRFLKAREISIGKAHKGMSLVARADYTLAFAPGKSWPDGWQEEFSHWLEQESIPVMKKGKRTEKEINIRPLIYEVRFLPLAEPAGAVSGKAAKRALEKAAEVSPVLRLGLSAGQEANLRPELVMEAFAKQTGKSWESFLFRINRDELFADRGGDGQHRFVRLIDLGRKLEGEHEVHH